MSLIHLRPLKLDPRVHYMPAAFHPEIAKPAPAAAGDAAAPAAAAQSSDETSRLATMLGLTRPEARYVRAIFEAKDGLLHGRAAFEARAETRGDNNFIKTLRRHLRRRGLDLEGSGAESSGYWFGSATRRAVAYALGRDSDG